MVGFEVDILRGITRGGEGVRAIWGYRDRRRMGGVYNKGEEEDDKMWFD